MDTMTNTYKRLKINDALVTYRRELEWNAARFKMAARKKKTELERGRIKSAKAAQEEMNKYYNNQLRMMFEIEKIERFIENGFVDIDIEMVPLL